MPYVDIDLLKESILGWYPSLDDKHLEYMIDTIPPVDIVYCKDCIHWVRNRGFTDSPNGYCFYHDITTNALDYCSYGERVCESAGQ